MVTLLQLFGEINTKTALYFWKTYPSPEHLDGKPAEELYQELRAVASNNRLSKAELIFECIQSDGNTKRDYQETETLLQ